MKISIYTQYFICQLFNLVSERPTMQKQKFKLITSATVILSLMLAPLAEAKRVGGGGNRGMSRSYSGQSYQRNNSYQSQRQYQPHHQSQPQTPRPQPQPQNGNGIGRVVGAGVAGAAIGALAGHAMANHNNSDNQNQQIKTASETATHHSGISAATTPASAVAVQPEQQPAPAPKEKGFNWIWLIVLAAIGAFIFRRFKNKNQNNQNNQNYSSFNNNFSQSNNNYSSANSRNGNTNIFGQQLNGSTATTNNNTLVDGSNPEAFLRFARQRFSHIQSMNSGTNLEEIRRYLTPEMFADIKQDIMNNHDVAEFSELQTELLGSTEENGQYIAGVRFSGLVSEELGSAAVPFSEIWHFVKPVNSQQDWLVAGIQQN